MAYQRRRQTSRREVDRTRSRSELKGHLKRLGLKTEKGYRQWCRNRGLGR